MVYEGARSVYGPLLAALGASATVVGLVTGAGEATALLLRLVSGPFADRTHRYWTLTLSGYALTAVCVPLLAVTPGLGAAGLFVAAGLILAERLGKAIRSPAKSALLAEAAGQVGMGRGLGVHKALDQIGAFAGPLLVAAIVVAAGGSVWPALAVLAVPGAASILILLVLRARTASEPVPADAAGGTVSGVPGPAPRPARPPAPADVAGRPVPPALSTPLPGRFWWFAVAAGLCTAGLVTYGLIGYHLTRDRLVGTAAVPLFYAAAMAAAAVAAPITGLLYDRAGPGIPLVLPIMVAAVPVLALSADVTIAVTGILLWGAATGVQDSTVKALVADIVPRHRRATAYGVFAAVQGAGALAGGAAAGALYEQSRIALVVAVAISQLLALIVLLLLYVLRPPAARPFSGG